MKKDQLKKIAHIAYKIEKMRSEQGERYKFNCAITDEIGITYPEIQIDANLNFIDGKAIVYTRDNKGFYYEQNDMLNKFMMILLDEGTYGKEEVLYTMHLLEAYDFPVEFERVE